MAIYYLFLDELKPNNYYRHFCLGGCIVEEMVYKNNVIPYINKLKFDVFGNTTIILHENEISGKNGEYNSLKDPAKNELLWNGLKDLFTKDWLTTMCVSLDCTSYKSTYKSKSKIDNSEYYIAMQIILENYLHFLETNNGYGAVYIESRGIVDDQHLEDQYNLVKSNGTLFFDKKIYQERLKTISFTMKADNNIGVQIADFIPNPIARHLKDGKQKTMNLYTEIFGRLYDGKMNLVDRFGHKNVL